VVEEDRKKIDDFIDDLEERCMWELFEDSEEGYIKAMRLFWLLAFKIQHARALP
jgi:hypothetical protein